MTAKLFSSILILALLINTFGCSITKTEKRIMDKVYLKEKEVGSYISEIDLRNVKIVEVVLITGEQIVFSDEIGGKFSYLTNEIVGYSINEEKHVTIKAKKVHYIKIETTDIALTVIVNVVAIVVVSVVIGLLIGHRSSDRLPDVLNED